MIKHSFNHHGSSYGTHTRQPAKPKGQKIPSNWTADGKSEGKQEGCVRQSPDAVQGPRGEEVKRNG